VRRDVCSRIAGVPVWPADLKEAGANDDGVGQVEVGSMAAACSFVGGSQWHDSLTANSGGSIPRKVAAAP
jgi:hypothetical protein